MARNILIVGLGEKCINLVVEEDLSVGYLKERICQREHIDAASFFLVHNGTPLEESAFIEAEDYSTTIVRAYPIVRGGKGGFGSLIRAIGMQINKSTNKQACRDLSGRRVRDIDAEKKVAKWLKAEPERRKKLEEEKRKRLTKKGESKHYFEDCKYMEQIKSTEENMGDALKQGLEAASSSKGVKRKQPASNGTSKKPKLWLGLDEAELDSDASSEIEDEDKVESAASRSSGESPDNMHGAGDGPGPSGLQNVVCSSQEMLHDNNPYCGDHSNTSSPEPDCGEDLPILLPTTAERETDEVKDRSEMERTEMEEGAQMETVSIEEMKRGPEIKNGDAEEKIGNSDDNSSGENSKEVSDERKRSSLSVQQQSSQSSEQTTKQETGREVTEEREKRSPSVQQQSSEQATKQEIEHEPIDLDNYSSVEELELTGPERLKAALQALGLKCGGTLQQRAQRLFSTKGKTIGELHPSLFAKASKQRRRKK